MTAGIAQALDSKWTVRGGLAYTNWATLGSASLSGQAATVLGTTSIPFSYKDSYSVSTGAEYKWSDDLTLRGGVAYETSPITTATRSFRLPDSDRLWLSTGFSYAVTKQTSVDFGYSFLHGFGSTIGNFALNGPFTGTYSSNSSIMSVAYRMKFD